MGRIRILEDHLVNQIAAGEVVERPASVLKELVENALDAQARALRVVLKAGGRSLIQVEDDGLGMDEADALMCLERHGTSKIRHAEDLAVVSSLGFRGEAIPSIASVSRFELNTRPASEEVGTRVVVEGGRLMRPEPYGGPPGTQVIVRDLFFNVPARRKFLRSVQTELAHCLEALTRELMIRPDVDLLVEHEGRELLRAPATGRRADRVVDLLGSVGEALVPVEMEEGALSVEALASPVGVHVADNGAVHLYVNGRPVRDPLLRRAVSEAYRQIVPKGRFPVVVLELRLPFELVDVNVHPSKTEVRFREPRAAFDLVVRALQQRLGEHGIRRPLETRPAPLPVVIERPPELPLAPAPSRPAPILRPEPAPILRPAQSTPGELAPSPPRAAGPPPAPSRPRPTEHEVEAPAEAPPGWPPAPPAPPPVAAEPPSSWSRWPGRDPLLPTERFQDLKVIGQYADTYIVCEGAGELVLIDQHAAHERVNLDKFRKQARERLGAAQRLLTPKVVELGAARAAALEGQLEALQEIGLDVEPFGQGAIAITGAPPGFDTSDLGRLLRDLAEELVQDRRGLAGRELADHVLATMACHASIRAHQALTPYEMRELLKALDTVEFAVCAHGRPVLIRFDATEVERRFHRS